MKVNHLHLMVPDVPAASAFFFLDSETRVDAVHGRLAADGMDVAPPKRTHAYSFYVEAPGGFLVEVGA